MHRNVSDRQDRPCRFAGSEPSRIALQLRAERSGHQGPRQPWRPPGIPGGTGYSPRRPESGKKSISHSNPAQIDHSARVGPAAPEQVPNEMQANAGTGRIWVPSCRFRLIVNSVHVRRNTHTGRMLESRPLGVPWRSTYLLEAVGAGPRSGGGCHASLRDSDNECSTASPEDQWPVEHIAEANLSTAKDVFLGEDSLVQRYSQTSTPATRSRPSHRAFHLSVTHFLHFKIL